MHYLIGVDIGTTNIKAVALDDSGCMLAQDNEPTATIAPFPGAAEQNPDLIVEQVVRVIRNTSSQVKSGTPLAGLVFSGAMHGLIALDKDEKPLTNAWLWSDLRAAKQARSMRNSTAGLEIYRRTGTPIHPMSPLLKIQWLRECQPDVFAQSRLFLGIKDYVLLKLLGASIADASGASATGLLHTASGNWDELALRNAGISAQNLPRVVSPGEVFRLPARTASLLGVPEGVPLIPGASDGALANLGSGAKHPDTLAITIGTSAALRQTLQEPSVDPQGRTFCYRLDDRRFIAGGASNNGGNVVEWLRLQLFKSRSSTDRLLKNAGTISPGCGGLLFVPYLYGERAPVWDAQATGLFYGLKASQTQATLLRAAVEGVIFNLRMIADVLPKFAELRQITFSGGAAASPVWQQTIADVFQRPVLRAVGRHPDASALGAVMLAREALGLPAMPEPQHWQIIRPQTENVDIYNDAFARFVQLCGLASTTNE